MATAFYIDFPRITAVEVGGSSRKPKLKRVEVGELPEPRNDDGTPIADKQGYLTEQIAAFVKEHKLAGGKHYLLVSPEAMRYRDMKLAFSDRRQIDKVIEFQVEGVIPNMPIDELKVGYNILVVEPDGARILVHAAEKKYIRERITALEEAGCAVENVDSHLSGTLNLGLLHPEFAKDQPPSLWIDFAGTTATVTVVENNEAHATRVFVSPYIARSKVDQVKDEARAVAADAEQRYDEFHGAEGESTDSTTIPRTESVNIGEEEVADRIRHMTRDELLKFVNRVAVEAKRTLMMSQFDSEPERLVVSGLGESGDQMAELLGNELMLEDARAIELMDAVNPPGKEGERKVYTPDIGELSYLTGVALKGVGRDYTGIDFRYGDLAPGTLLDYAKTPLAFTATLALLFAGIMFLISYTQARQYDRDIEALRDQKAGPQYYFDLAYRTAEKLGNDPEYSVESVKNLKDRNEKRERSYPGNPEDPAAEIRNAHMRLKAHQDRLRGETDTNYAEPHAADEMLSVILETFQKARPSYDFALLEVRIQESAVTVEYLASLKENADARDGKKVTESETARIFTALKQMVADHTEWFDGSIEQTSSSGQEGPDGRSADKIEVRMGVKKVEPPRKRSSSKRRRS